MKVEIHQRPLDQSARQLPNQLHPVIARILLARGVDHPDQLSYRLQQLARPELLDGMEQAVGLVVNAIESNQRIIVVGDFDADGATASAFSVRCLRQFGAVNVDYCVPNRFEHGYGLSRALVNQISPQLDDLLITVDNGISSIDGVLAVHERQARVIITDHHLPGPKLPEADAIVNPRLKNSQFASENLAGVGVVFYLMAAVRTHLLKLRDVPATALPSIAALLDLVALGTVADLVSLDHNNRILVSQGLQRIRGGKACPGIHELLMIAGRDPRHACAADLAFAVAPRLNAAGRLEDMSVGIECLLTDDHAHAAELATQLNELNQERKQLQQDMCDDADQILSEVDLNNRTIADQKIITVHHEQWHQGVVGLVASRVKERHHRPVIAFAPESPGSAELKGSARSIDGFHIRDAIAAVDAANPGLIQRFGGHAMAAGLSLSAENYPLFAEKIQQYADLYLSPELISNRIMTDGELASDDFTLELASAIEDWGPWGQTFPEPLFDGCFEVMEYRLVGGKHLKMIVRHPNSSALIDAIAFGFGIEDLAGQSSIRLVYHLQINRFRGRQTTQMLVRHIQPD